MIPALSLLVALAAPPAGAPSPAWTFNLGGDCGASFGTPGLSGFAGVDLSVNLHADALQAGVYGDAGYDLGWRVALLTAGPRIRLGSVGVDAGPGLVGDAGRQSLAGAGRVLWAAGAMIFFGRYVYAVDSGAHLGQLGLLVSLPVWEAP